LAAILDALPRPKQISRKERRHVAPFQTSQLPSSNELFSF